MHVCLDSLSVGISAFTSAITLTLKAMRDASSATNRSILERTLIDHDRRHANLSTLGTHCCAHLGSLRFEGSLPRKKALSVGPC